MLSRARPIYRNIGKGGICHSWQKHSKATKEEDIVFQQSVLQQKGTQHVWGWIPYYLQSLKNPVSAQLFMCRNENG